MTSYTVVHPYVNKFHKSLESKRSSMRHKTLMNNITSSWRSDAACVACKRGNDYAVGNFVPSQLHMAVMSCMARCMKLAERALRVASTAASSFNRDGKNNQRINIRVVYLFIVLTVEQALPLRFLHKEHGKERKWSATSTA